MTDANALPHVVILGSGFGGLRAAQDLKRAPVRVTVVDRHNHHLFQPLLYQVATATMMAESIAVPIRSVLGRQKNATVLLDSAESVDLTERKVALGSGETLHYDYLIIAVGARTHYFGNDAWQAHTLGLKSVADAYDIRRRVLMAFEAAEREQDAAVRRKLLTFVVVGGGPTGVEMAGALSELSRHVMAKDFRTVQAADIRVVLLEAAPSLLLAFDKRLQQYAIDALTQLGVEVRTKTGVTAITEDGVHMGDEFIASNIVVWAAGVAPQPLAAHVKGVTPTSRGFLPVQNDCSLKGFPEAFAVGDVASFIPAQPEGSDPNKPVRPLPGVAPVAVQQAAHVAKMIRNDLSARPRRAFSYFNKGNMATIGKSRAVLEVGWLRMRGFLAWVAWLLVHVLLLVGFRNRVVVMFEWAVAYLSGRRGARLIARYDAPTRRDSAVQEELGEAGKDGAVTPPKAGWVANRPASS